MSPNRRILLNIVATYGRSLYALVVGLFTARWALQILGHVDYGLMGVVGGLTGFISFFNSWIAMAVSRFYAISVGKLSVSANPEVELEECRKWFSTAIFIHTIVPVVFMLIGYPLGIWAVKNFLIIPPDRVADCVWVFRFVCVTCFVSMVAVPVSAMYTAKQYIAELTIYSFVTTTINAGILYYMLIHPGVWLAKYAFCSCCLSVLPQAIIMLRGWWMFDECRLRLRYCISKERFRGLAYFVGWWSFGCFGGLLRGQGIQILVNKYFGPQVNASMTVANSVNTHTTTLSGAMLGAFQPAIVSACGAGDETRMRSLAYRACKFSMLFILVFMLPLALELHEILRVWLINPPRYVYGLCLAIFATTLIDQSAVGHMLAVNAKGKIAMYQMALGTCHLLSLPLAWLFCALGYGVYFVAIALFLTMAFCALGRVWFARKLAGMSARYWALSIMLPILIVTTCGTFFGLLPRFFMEESFSRIVVTTIFCEVTFIPLVWFVLFDNSEREFVLKKIPWLRKA